MRKSVADPPSKRGYRIAAGVMTIISSCLCLIGGFVGMILGSHGILALTLGIMGFIAFAFGLTAGILTLMRKVFSLIIIGEVLVLVEGVLAFLPISYSYYWGYYTVSVWPLGVPVVILIILSLIFTALAKTDFQISKFNQ